MNYGKLLKHHRTRVKASMKALGVYREEYEPVMEIYSGMLAQYEILTQRLIDSDLDIEVATQRGGARKSPIATAQEKLRADIIVYTDRLMLNPKALLSAKLEVGEKPSLLAKVLAELERSEDESPPRS